MKTAIIGILWLCAAAPATVYAAAPSGDARGVQTRGVARPESAETVRWRQHAAHVSIIRDDFGIAHVYGKSDADAVFGAIYAQAEDDFGRIERNYLNGLGWMAQAQGESAIYQDLRERLFVDPQHLEQLYATCPIWLRKLTQAWADGLNYYLSKHPQAAPKFIRHFEPWMALSFTEGSIGGDVEAVDLRKLEEFYGATPAAPSAAMAQAAPVQGAPLQAVPLPGGSNGFAISPARSASGHALLWINPHTSYYFRSELQMVSDEGLNVYGATTWGQFFIYQGFNPHNGWMHTSFGGDAVDEYAETIEKKSDGLYYRYGNGTKRLRAGVVTIRYKQGESLHGASLHGASLHGASLHGASFASRSFTVYYSHHGPIIRAENGKWIAIKLLQDPVRALEQSYLRTKTHDYQSFRETQDMRTDTSNNTVYADADGTIAYFHGNFIPKRDPHFDYAHVVDGSNPATEWHGPHALEDTITLKNPRSGWIANTNNWPFSAAGPSSPKREDYPAYMWTKGENPRGLHAAQVLQDIRDVTLDSLIAAGYDAHLTGFDALLPPLIAAFDALPAEDGRRQTLREPIDVLRSWDRRTAVDSIATAVAIFWAQELADRESAAARAADEPVYDYMVEHLSDAARLDALSAALAKLSSDFGRWQTPWGEINRFQRLSDDIQGRFDDSLPSLPVGFAPAQWGALASFDSAKPRHTKKIYGSVGNSFVAAVEFGPTVRAKAIMSGGESGDPSSPHFTDQALMFSRGIFRDVYFTPEDVRAHAEHIYHP
jgi:acyl-homoserine-lactone acylase